MVAAHLLPRLIQTFLSERPGLRLTVAQAGAEEIGSRVLRGELELGIVADWRTPEGLTAELLEQHPMVACVAASSSLGARSRLSWAELIDQSLILFPHGYHQRSRIEDAAARLGRALDVVVEAEAVPLIVELVRHGSGVATLLAGAAAGLPGITSLSLPSEATVPIAICRRTNAAMSAIAAAFHAHLLKNTKAHGRGAFSR
jgi:DNA-binding transcriptional LysR family regulator